MIAVTPSLYQMTSNALWTLFDVGFARNFAKGPSNDSGHTPTTVPDTTEAYARQIQEWTVLCVGIPF